jgi:poly(beta-D-mannuronate) lyase
LKGTEGGSGYKWMGNVASTSRMDRAGIRVVDVKLERGGDGMWRPAKDSPARSAAEGNFPTITTDVDGQPRKGRLDAGCDQLSDAPVFNHPLTAADVGPAWMDVKSRSGR